MDKFLITGAAGFTGSHLVELLLKEGIKPGQLKLLVPEWESLDYLPKKEFDIIRADIRDEEVIKASLKGVNVIYHLAAMTVSRNKTLNDYRSVNVKGTLNLLNNLNPKKIKKFVHFSSISVYGLPAYVGEIKGWNETRSKDPREDYGRSKLEAEEILLKFHEKTKMPYAIVKPTTIYGPRDHQSLIELYRAIDKHYFFMIGDGKNLMDYVYIGDLVKGARQAEKSKRKTGDYILGCGTPISFKQIVDTVADSLNTWTWPINIPKQIALPAASAFQFFNSTTGIKVPFFPNRVKVMTTTCYFDISKAKKEIGYSPSTNFSKGAKITAQYYLKDEKDK